MFFSQPGATDLLATFSRLAADPAGFKKEIDDAIAAGKDAIAKQKAAQKDLDYSEREGSQRTRRSC